MKKSCLTAFACLLMIVFSGCAPVQIYSDKELKQKSGLKYYTVKPFLHIEREAETGRIVKAVIVYLPDLAHPQYMVIHDGLGSKKVNLKFTDGSINTFGYSSVGKTGEAVDALAALISKSTDAINEIKGIQPVKAPGNIVELYEIVFEEKNTTLHKVEVVN